MPQFLLLLLSGSVVAAAADVFVVVAVDNVTYVVAVVVEFVTALGSCWFLVYLWAIHAVAMP